MGEQIKVLDIARSLIRLSGLNPGKDIPIRFVGLRPGEKLYEELVGEGEVAVQSSLEKILQIRTISHLDFEEFREKLSGLEAASYGDATGVLLERLKEIVPMFQTFVSDAESSTVPTSSF
jgi:FlaA1/EpsC-like NDP-sugar epimerase